MAPRPKKKTYTVSLENKKARGAGHERKDEILDAARLLFLREGVGAVSTRRIAQLVGVSQTSLYVYFENKEAILSAMTDAAFARLESALDEVERRASGPIEYLREAIPRYMRFGLEYPDEYRLAFMVAGQVCAGDASGSGRGVVGLRVFAAMAARVVEAMDRGLVDGHGATAQGIAQSVWASIHGLVAARLAFPGFDWVSAEEQIAQHTRFVMDGLGSERATSPCVGVRGADSPRGSARNSRNAD